MGMSVRREGEGCEMKLMKGFKEQERKGKRLTQNWRGALN